MPVSIADGTQNSCMAFFAVCAIPVPAWGNRHVWVGGWMDGYACRVSCVGERKPSHILQWYCEQVRKHRSLVCNTSNPPYSAIKNVRVG